MKSFRVFQNHKEKKFKEYTEAKGTYYFQFLGTMTVKAFAKVKQDIEKASEGDADSIFEVSQALFEGKYIQANYKMAVALAAISGMLGNSRAALFVAQAFNKSINTSFMSKTEFNHYTEMEKSTDKYLSWLLHAENLGSYSAGVERKKINTLDLGAIEKPSADAVIKELFEY